MINRKIDRIFDEFYDLNTREALLVNGARQVGKTFSIREFGKRHFKTLPSHGQNLLSRNGR